MNMSASSQDEGASAPQQVRSALPPPETVPFERLYDLHHGRVFQIALGVLGDVHVAEDVSQDVFLTVHRKIGSFEHRAKFTTWLYRVTVNAAISAKRRVDRHSTAPLLEDPHATEHPRVGRLESREVAAYLLRPLGKTERHLLRLRFRKDLCHGELATVLGCSYAGAAGRVHGALRKLREHWKDRRDEIGLAS